MNDYVVMFCGSRTFSDRHVISWKLLELKRLWGDSLVIWTGGATGADQIAEKDAMDKGIRMLPSKKPDYKKYAGRIAPIIRNREMVKDPRVKEVVAFWDGRSPGTASVINHCNLFRKNYSVIFDGEGGD